MSQDAQVPEPLDVDVPDWDGDVGDAAAAGTRSGAESPGRLPERDGTGTRLSAVSILVLVGIAVVIAGFIAWVVVARGPRTTPQQRDLQPARPAPEGPAPDELAAGAALYEANCAECHGSGGDGTPSGPSLRVRGLGPARLDDRVLVGFVTNGGGAMAGFGDRLDQGQISEIVRYVRWLQGYGPGSAPPDPDE